MFHLASKPGSSELLIVVLFIGFWPSFVYIAIFLIVHIEGHEEVENKTRLIVDVRDVAEALKLVYEKPQAEGRYICSAYMLKTKDIVEELRKIYPDYKYPKR